MGKVYILSKTEAVALNLTGAKKSASVQVGPNVLYQPTQGKVIATNNLAGLCKAEKKR